MRVLLVSPEITPIQKAGGVADGVAGLAKALCRFGHEVTIALPFCGGGVPPGFSEAPAVVLAAPGGAPVTVARREGRIDPGLSVILFLVPGVPPDRGVYGSDTGADLTDARRFALFTRAVTQTVHDRAREGAPFDVVHAHEWPAAPALYLLSGTPNLQTVLTVHNLAFQGTFPQGALAWLGLGTGHFHPGALEHHGRVNYLKAGIVSARAVTTVSPTYAREILAPDHGELLDGVLRARGDSVIGILNGLDAEAWNPLVDPALPAPFGPEDPAGKAACKQALLDRAGLAAGPLVAWLGRLVDQKGADWLIEALPAITEAGATVAIAGAGDHAIAVAAAAARLPGKAVYLGRAADEDARRLLAAADLVILPSRWEPCGIVQMEAQRYGAIPVARRTGGLGDTIADASADLDRGTGFLFDDPGPAGLIAAVRRAIAAMSAPGFPALVRRAMRSPPSWTAAARRYEAVYRGAPMR